MGLLSYFKRNNEPAAEAPAAAAPDAVALARVRARRRLIGATVLLGIGVIGFPLLFETQPRPVPVNIPIEIPRKDGAPPPVLLHGPAQPALSPASAAVLVEPPSAELPAPVEITEREADQGRELPLPAAAPLVPPSAAARASAAAKPASQPAKPASAAAKPASVPAKPASAAAKPGPDKASAPKPPAAKPDDGQRARALLDGQPASAATLRIVVQVGAYTEAAKLAEARHKLETMGLKTYTQVVEAEGGKRTRVRVGPFASRAEADKAAARIKAAGLPVAILTL
jgi:DedD protein